MKIFALLALMIAPAYADGPDPDMTVQVSRGSYTGTTAISVGTAGDVALVSADRKRPDLTCRNNSAFTVYIGTDSASTSLTSHGFPVLANEVFVLGAFSDAVYAIASGGTADVRCWAGQIR